MASPLLQYQFNSINNSQVTDYASAIKSSVNKGCCIVTDSMMGNCLHFDGQTGFLSLADLNFNFAKGMTLTAWVNYEKFNEFSRIIDFGNGPAASNIVLYNQQSSNELGFQNGIGTTWANLCAENSLNLNEWMHISLTVNPLGIATFYVDGIQIATETNKAFIPESVNRKSNFIGKSNWAGNGLFQGKMAWLSMYNEVLSADDILEDMNQALVARGAFRSSFPVDFALDTNHQGTMAPIIFLESSANPETLFLTVKNKSNTTLLLSAAASHAASVSNYHLQLRFRPGVLSPKFISNGKVTVKSKDTNSASAWQTNVGVDSAGNAYISFLATGKALPQIKGFGEYQFSIEGVQADPSGGARTTNIEFFYKQLSFSASSAPIQGGRLQHMDIINHIGQKNIPIHVDVVGSPAILNDGKTPNEVLVRIVNTSNNDIPLSASHPASAFAISINGQPKDSLVEWALAEMDDLANIQMHWGIVAIAGACSNANTIPLSKPLVKTLLKGSTLNITPPANKNGANSITLAEDCDQGATSLSITTNENVLAESSITVAINGQEPWLPPAETSGPDAVNWSILNGNQKALKAGDSLVFLLSNIVTGLKSGATSITINYSNIPGYWDGTFRIDLVKSPLVTLGGNVGIGVNQPCSTLEVNGNVTQSVYQPAKLGPALTLENSGGGANSEAAIFFKSFPTGKYDATSAIVAHDDGNGSNSLYFQFKTPGAHSNPLLTQTTMNAEGMNVVGTITGVGMVPPGGVLMQSGSLNNHYDSSGKGIRGTPYEGWAVCNGENGTPDLQDRFIVGAGRDAGPNTAGGPDVHTHGVDAPAQNFSSSQDGQHHHLMPSAWYNRGLSCGCHSGIDTRGTDVSKDVSQDAGQHGHTVNVNLNPFNSGPSGGLSRPKYYALYFIVRLSQ